MKIFILLWVLIVSSASAKITVRDSYNTAINLKQTAKRIISLSPNLTEIVYEVGAGKLLVARDSCSNFPSQALKLPVVGSYYKINIEKIVKLNPDLVLLEQAAFTRKDIQLLNQFGIQVYVNHANSINSIPKTMADVGKLSGHEKQGRIVAEHFSKKFSELTDNKKSPVSVFYELWHAPLMSVNDQTLIGEVLFLCGGRNVVGNLKSQTPKISYETVIKADPDFIICSVNDSKWGEFGGMKAVRNHRVFYVEPSLIERTGPRVLLGMARVCRILQH